MLRPASAGHFFATIFHTIDHYLCITLTSTRDTLRFVLLKKKNQHFLNGLTADVFVLAP